MHIYVARTACMIKELTGASIYFVILHKLYLHVYDIII